MSPLPDPRDAADAARPAEAIAAFLNERLPPPAPPDVPVVWRAGEGAVGGVALALDPPGPEAAPRPGEALFLHRPFALAPDAWPGAWVFAAHAGFDRALTTGYNPALARALGACAWAPLAGPRGEPGMRLDFDPPAPWRALRPRLFGLFGGLEAAREPADAAVARAAVWYAMNAALVAETRALGAQLYLTGQLRVPGQAEAAEAGLGLVAIGHRRSERWALGVLAADLARAFPGLAVRVLE